jgi:hypothetical protein
MLDDEAFQKAFHHALLEVRRACRLIERHAMLKHSASIHHRHHRHCHHRGYNHHPHTRPTAVLEHASLALA